VLIAPQEQFDFLNLVATMATGGDAMQVGIRDLKNKLTHYLEMAKRGHAVIITDRGAPVAVMHNLDQIEEEAGSEERLAYLAGQGFLSLPKTSDEPAFEPLERAEAKGGSVSETIIGDRR
jgi:antitoxin (DNA-binding transcriptional repressor) of toxin-antitoxin stability system